MEIREELHRPEGASDTVALFSPRRSRSGSEKRHASTEESEAVADQIVGVIDRPPEFSDNVKMVASQLGIPTSTVSEVNTSVTSYILVLVLWLLQLRRSV